MWSRLGQWCVMMALACSPLFAHAQSLAAESKLRDRQNLLVISYHDIRDDVAKRGDPDVYAVSTRNLAQQFDWLAANGYHPISMAQLVDNVKHGRPLPDRPVLLTFDDGLRSAYTKAFPLLRAYNYPAVVAVVTSWLDLPEGKTFDYGPRFFGRDDFLTWDQLKEMKASGLIEVASHTHDMHMGVLANPQGNETPAVITHLYDAKTGRYESDADYKARLKRDLDLSSTLIERHLGAKPTVLVWPYAAYNAIANAVADDAGFQATFDLEDRNPNKIVNLHGLGRSLLMGNPDAAAFASNAWEVGDQAQTTRALQIDLDQVYDPDPIQQGKNLDALIERVARIAPSHVYLQAFADPDGNNTADAVYFPNRHLPMRADLFSRVAWQLRTRAGVAVFAWLPVLGFEFGDAQWRLRHGIKASGKENFRIDFTDPEARRWARDMYEDLARQSYIAGLLFHDDAYLRDDELPALKNRSQALIDFTLELKAAAEVWRPKLKTIRNLFAQPVLNPNAEAWYAQDLKRFNAAYDYTAIMAMPYMEQAARPSVWLAHLIEAARKEDPTLSRTVFELQTVDWRTGKPVSGKTLTAQVRMLVAAGANHIAWYPDDFVGDTPSLRYATEAMSARTYPYKKP